LAGRGARAEYCFGATALRHACNRQAAVSDDVPIFRPFDANQRVNSTMSGDRSMGVGIFYVVAVINELVQSVSHALLATFERHDQAAPSKDDCVHAAL
jgi:hypothetical protein